MVCYWEIIKVVRWTHGHSALIGCLDHITDLNDVATITCNGFSLVTSSHCHNPDDSYMAPVWRDDKMTFAQAQQCVRKDYGHGSVVCVCNATYCDFAAELSDDQLTGKNLAHYVSSKSGHRLLSMTMEFSSSTCKTSSTS
uniref:Glucosylceramidase n=1 Tax=Timema cristinae TaxID=61476 RepID=A0A7R9CDK9_TIMCR|nr:unnamed protein product [Timema cristinae]